MSKHEVSKHTLERYGDGGKLPLENWECRCGATVWRDGLALVCADSDQRIGAASASAGL